MTQPPLAISQQPEAPLPKPGSVSPSQGGEGERQTASPTPQLRPNFVLDLDGAGDWVRLPPAGFTMFQEATIEAWVKFRSFKNTDRVFDFGARQREQYVGVSLTPLPNSVATKFLIVDTAGTRRREDVFGGFRLNEWTHVAVITGPGGVRMLLNGVLVMTNDFAGSLSSLGAENFFLGQQTHSNDAGTLDGQLDEVRVWSVQRTEEEIRVNLFRRLTGREPGLAGLWNFDDPAQPARDASVNGFHGAFFGDAKTVPAELPASVIQPSLIEGHVIGPEGVLVSDADVAIGPPEFFQEGASTALQEKSVVGTSDRDGRFRMAVFGLAESLALGGRSRDKELFGLRTDVVLVPGQRRELDVLLQGIVTVAGTVMAIGQHAAAGCAIDSGQAAFFAGRGTGAGWFTHIYPR
jgi:hypothetical protein